MFACKRAVVIGCGLMFFSAITGINSVIFYSSTIFGFAGFDNAIAATVAVGLINFIATAVAAYLVDIYGRRQLLWVGTNAMVISLIMLAVVLLGANGTGAVQGVFAVIAVLAYVVGFAFGLGAVSWVVLSEIMSTHLRSKAFGLFVSINWGSNLVIGLTTLTGIYSLMMLCMHKITYALTVSLRIVLQQSRPWEERRTAWMMKNLKIRRKKASHICI